MGFPFASVPPCPAERRKTMRTRDLKAAATFWPEVEKAYRALLPDDEEETERLIDAEQDLREDWSSRRYRNA
jgi:hypothetical protein